MATFVKIETQNDNFLVNVDNVRYCRSSKTNQPGKTIFMFDNEQSLTLDITIDTVEGLTRDR